MKRKEILLGRRQEKGLFGGLWELPSADYPMKDSELDGALSSAVGTKLSVKKNLGVVRRTLTHRDLELHLFEVSGRKAPVGGVYTELRWVAGAELPSLGMSTAMAKAVELIHADAG